MRLCLDQGNTALKWWLCQGSIVIRSGFELGVGGSALKPVLESIGINEVDSVVLACVAGQKAQESIRSFVVSRLGCQPYVAQVEDRSHGLVLAYSDTLGVDRWLAMIAAKKESNAGFMLLSLGTAVTFDVVDAAGNHQGGFIVPGIEASFRGLQSSTADVRAVAGLNDGKPSLGRSTQACVQAGVSFLYEAFLRALMSEYGDQSERVFVAGGARNWAIKVLPDFAEARDDLVLRGLLTVCESANKAPHIK